jgi:hypothetical protein
MAMFSALPCVYETTHFGHFFRFFNASMKLCTVVIFSALPLLLLRKLRNLAILSTFTLFRLDAVTRMM